MKLVLSLNFVALITTFAYGAPQIRSRLNNRIQPKYLLPQHNISLEQKDFEFTKNNRVNSILSQTETLAPTEQNRHKLELKAKTFQLNQQITNSNSFPFNQEVFNSNSQSFDQQVTDSNSLPFNRQVNLRNKNEGRKETNYQQTLPSSAPQFQTVTYKPDNNNPVQFNIIVEPIYDNNQKDGEMQVLSLEPSISTELPLPNMQTEVKQSARVFYEGTTEQSITKIYSVENDKSTLGTLNKTDYSNTVSTAKPKRGRYQPLEAIVYNFDYPVNKTLMKHDQLVDLHQAEKAVYSFSTSFGNNEISQSRSETRNGLKLTGHYSYSDGYYKRTVYYAADENGYRVIKEETEKLGSEPAYEDESTE